MGCRQEFELQCSYVILKTITQCLIEIETAMAIAFSKKYPFQTCFSFVDLVWLMHVTHFFAQGVASIFWILSVIIDIGQTHHASN